MSAGPFIACLDFTRREEGGYTCDPRDSGNWSSGVAGNGRLIGSNMGVSAPTLISWLGQGEADTVDQKEMRALPEPTYQAIARARYWRSLGCDGLAPAIAMMVFDFGWNVGVGRSGSILQRVLGLKGAAVDGDVGEKTLKLASTPAWTAMLECLPPAAIKELQARCGLLQDGLAGGSTRKAVQDRPALWPLALTLRLAQEQASEYRGFGNFATYGNGWLARTTRRLGAARELVVPSHPGYLLAISRAASTAK